MPQNRRRRNKLAHEAISECFREWYAAVTIQRAFRRSQLLTAEFVLI